MKRCFVFAILLVLLAVALASAATYRNDGNQSLYVTDTSGQMVLVAPGSTVQTYEPLADDGDPWTQTSATPSLETTISTNATWSTPIKLTPGRYSFNIRGTWSGTLTYQESYDYGVNASAATWYDVEDFTANAAKNYETPETVWTRWGFDTGALTSGSATGRIGALKK